MLYTHGKKTSLFDTFRYAMNTLYRLGIQVFLVPLSQVYNTKHLSMQSTFKNIFSKKTDCKELSEFEYGSVIDITITTSTL